VAKGKKKRAIRVQGPPELLVIEAELFPSAVIVELWHRTPKGKREFLDSRRFEVTDENAAAPVADASEALSVDGPSPQQPDV
jgi:hypothetical protein